MRVLVSGGRDFTDEQLVFRVLDHLHQKIGIDALIEGEATGVDTFGKNWAISRQVVVEPYPADWDRYEGYAGRVRNAQMLREGKPDVLITFPGGDGTIDMRFKAIEAGVETVRIRRRQSDGR